MFNNPKDYTDLALARAFINQNDMGRFYTGVDCLLDEMLLDAVICFLEESSEEASKYWPAHSIISGYRDLHRYLQSMSTARDVHRAIKGML